MTIQSTGRQVGNVGNVDLSATPHYPHALMEWRMGEP